MRVRDYEQERDFDLYLEAERESFKATYPGLQITREMENYFRRTIRDSFDLNEDKGFTLEVEGVPCGMLIVSKSSFFNVPRGYVSNIYIQEPHRGSGALELLFEKAESYMKNEGMGIMQLDVSVLNESAVQAYKKMGYTPVRLNMEKKL